MSQSAEQHGEQGDCFFVGMVQYERLSRTTKAMALAMVPSPIGALRKACEFRGLPQSGTRAQLILSICEHFDSGRRA